MSKDKAIFYLLTAYVISVSFQMFNGVPYVDDKIQLAELIFGLLLIAFLVIRPNWLRPSRFVITDAVAIAYPCVVLVNYLFNGQASIILEAAGAVYLAAVYYVFSRYLISTRWLSRDIVLAWSKLTLVVSCLFACSAAISIWGDIDVGLAQNFIAYPYLGDTYRLQGLTKTPNMLMSITALATLTILCWYRSRNKWLWVSIGLLVCLATFSKSNLILWYLVLVTAALTKLFRSRQAQKILHIGGATLLTVIFVILTMFVVDRNGEQVGNRLLGSVPVFQAEGGDIQVYGTLYYYLKRVMILTIGENATVGVGFGEFQESLTEYKERGIYPDKLLNYGPHDSYLGIVTEGGLLGILLLIVMCCVVIQVLRLSRQESRNHQLALVLIVFMCIEATCIDAWNFRQYWLALAILALIALQSEKTQDANSNVRLT